MKSWGFLETGACATELVNMDVQKRGYERGANEPAPAH
jgi:hypothetical protein